MTDQFHSPYQFIRPKTTEEFKGSECASYDDIKSGATHVRHDVYESNSHTGRIYYSIETMSPMFIGSGKQPAKTDSPLAEIAPFELDGKRAIPGSSARGLLASSVELLSNSAMRVLDDTKHSVRMINKKAFHAIGMITKEPESERLFIQPLALTSIEIDSNTTKEWQKVFGTKDLQDYLACRFELKPENTKFPNLKTFRNSSGNALDNSKELLAQCQGTIPSQQLYVKDRSFYLGEKLNSVPESDPSLIGKPNTVAGIFYRTGYPEVQKLTFSTKKNCFFIPWDEHKTLPGKLVIPSGVAKTFRETYRRSDLFHNSPKSNGSTTQKRKPLPILPFGYSHEDDPLVPGRLIMFECDPQSRVTGLSFTAIWRRPLEHSMHELFVAATDEKRNILPWHHKRSVLTTAEAMFGVVEDDVGDEDRSGRNLASRVSVSNGVALEGSVSLDSPVAIRPLSSPKPPSPSMYFHSKDGGYIERESLDRSGSDGSYKHLPNGRKMYLSHVGQSSIEKKTWKSAFFDVDGSVLMKNNALTLESYKRRGGGTIRTISAGQRFTGYVDIVNLTDQELALLLIAMNPNAAPAVEDLTYEFFHTFGFGKPVGLGSVRLQPLIYIRKDYSSRYSVKSALEATEPCTIYAASSYEESRTEMQAIYPELANLSLEQMQALDNLVSADELVDTESLSALMSTADPDARRDQNVNEIPISYPFTGDQGAHCQTTGFEWYVAQAQSKRENLGSLNGADGQLGMKPLEN